VDLLAHWRAFAGRKNSSNQLHPADAAVWPPRTKIVNSGSDTATEVADRIYAAECEPKAVDASLVPIPFIGALDRHLSRIVVLMDQPPFSFDDHYAEEPGSLLRQALEAALTLKTNKLRLPDFYPLDSKLATKPIAKHWLGSSRGQFNLAELVEVISNSASPPMENVRLYLERRLAVLFATPYRSPRRLPPRVFQLPSSQRAIAFANLLLQEATQFDRILILADPSGRFGRSFKNLRGQPGQWVRPNILRAPVSENPYQGVPWTPALVNPISKVIAKALRESATYGGPQIPSPRVRGQSLLSRK